LKPGEIRWLIAVGLGAQDVRDYYERLFEPDFGGLLELCSPAIQARLRVAAPEMEFG
jgi:hypothetical protein